MGQYISCGFYAYEPVRNPSMKWYLSQLELPDADVPEAQYGTGHGGRPLGDGLGSRPRALHAAAAALQRLPLPHLPLQPCSACRCSQPGAARVPAGAPVPRRAHPCTRRTPGLAACRVHHFPGPGAQLRQQAGALGHVPTPGARLVQASLLRGASTQTREPPPAASRSSSSRGPGVQP
jgi:hypothetical protein